MSLPDASNPSTSTSSWPTLFRTSRPQNEAVDESDEDLFTVPDLESGQCDSTAKPAMEIRQSQSSGGGGAAGKRRRGRNPADKECKRLKRLLRNRVSAQQARERKKVYVNDLESRARELQDQNAKLEEKISTLINENAMLRKILMNTRPKVDESTET